MLAICTSLNENVHERFARAYLVCPILHVDPPVLFPHRLHIPSYDSGVEPYHSVTGTTHLQHFCHALEHTRLVESVHSVHRKLSNLWMRTQAAQTTEPMTQFRNIHLPIFRSRDSARIQTKVKQCGV